MEGLPNVPFFQAPDPNGLKEAWMDICGSIPGMKKQELSAVPPAKPVAKTLPRNAQARPAEPLTEKGTARSSGLLMAKMEVAEAGRFFSKSHMKPQGSSFDEMMRCPNQGSFTGLYECISSNSNRL